VPGQHKRKGSKGFIAALTNRVFQKKNTGQILCQLGKGEGEGGDRK